MSNYGKLTSSLSQKPSKETHQTVQTPGTVMNNAGGYVYEISKWDMLDRFLILGSESNTYYCSEAKMTMDNAKNVIECIKEDGIRVVNRIVEVSDKGEASKNDSALFALALCAAHQGSTPSDAAVRKFALDSLPKVARIGTHLFQFAHFVDSFRGWGSGLRNAIANWYNTMDAERLALQVVKYPNRTAEEGNSKSVWSHKDLLRKSHATGDKLHNYIYDYVTKEGKLPSDTYRIPNELMILEGANKIKNEKDPKAVASLIEKYQLPHELVPKEVANDPIVWSALLPHMALNATLRTLNRLTAYGVIKPLSSELKMVVDRLNNQEYIKKSRIHPISVLSALKTYSQGRGMKGSLSWTPNQKIVDALNEMLYMSFDAITPSGKNILLGLDISGSMDSASIAGLPYVSAREASAVMAMVTARCEKNYHMIAFTDTNGEQYNKSSGVTDVNISPKDRLDKVISYLSAMPMGRTDCAIPVMYAIKNKLDVDAFVTYTDNETYAGTIKPMEALKKYRNEFKAPEAKMIAVGMTATKYSIVDATDRYCLNVCGFSTSAPAVISNFISK